MVPPRSLWHLPSCFANASVAGTSSQFSEQGSNLYYTTTGSGLKCVRTELDLEKPPGQTRTLDPLLFRGEIGNVFLRTCFITYNTHTHLDQCVCVCTHMGQMCLRSPFAGQVVCRRHEASIFLCLYYYTQLLAVPAPVSISGAVSDTVWPKKRERESWIVLLMLLSAFDDAAAAASVLPGEALMNLTGRDQL